MQHNSIHASWVAHRKSHCSVSELVYVKANLQDGNTAVSAFPSTCWEGEPITKSLYMLATRCDEHLNAESRRKMLYTTHCALAQASAPSWSSPAIVGEVLILAHGMMAVEAAWVEPQVLHDLPRLPAKVNVSEASGHTSQCNSLERSHALEHTSSAIQFPIDTGLTQTELAEL